MISVKPTIYNLAQLARLSPKLKKVRIKIDKSIIDTVRDHG